jgi:hypothetical protein
MSNNFPTVSRIFIKILSILVHIVLSMKSLGFDAIHFRILNIARLCFQSNVFGRFFRLKIVSILSFWRENQSGQLHFTADSCVSERAVAKNRPALKGSSANQIASFSLIKITYLILTWFTIGTTRAVFSTQNSVTFTNTASYFPLAAVVSLRIHCSPRSQKRPEAEGRGKIFFSTDRPKR